MNKLKKRKGLHGVIVRKDGDKYYVVMSCSCASANGVKQYAKYLADHYHNIYIPLFFRNYYQAMYYHLEIEGVTRDTIPHRHRGCEYKPTA